MFTLFPDVYLSRRQRLHHVSDNLDDVVWSGGALVEALDFLLDKGEREFRVDGGQSDLSYILTVRRA